MKILIICFSLFSFPIFLKSQNQGLKSITDSTYIVGVVKSNSMVGKKMWQFCKPEFEMELKAGAELAIAGVRVCTHGYPRDTFFLYEFYQDDIIHLIESDRIRLKDFSLNDLLSLDSLESIRFRKNALTKSKYYQQKYNELKVKNHSRALNFIQSCSSHGLVLYDYKFYDQSEYTNGTSARVTVYNPTRKTIKYVWFNFIAYNAVGDKVIDPASKKSLITRQGIGPIESNESGAYDFEYVWFTDIVHTAKIASIKVQYMDGTEKLITNIDAIKLSDEFRVLLEEGID